MRRELVMRSVKTIQISETLGNTKFSNFSFYGQNPKVCVDHSLESLLSSTLLWCCFSILASLNFGKFISFGLVTVRSERDCSRGQEQSKPKSLPWDDYGNIF